MSDTPLLECLLRMGDNALVLGQRLAQWTGHGPALEEDLASTNVALDLVGQARLWLGYAGEVEGRGRDEDALAFFRSSGDFRNVLLVEQPNGDYADTVARQFLFDTWHFFWLQRLGASADARIAAIAQKAVREVEYHVRRSGDWVVRLGDGTETSHVRMQTSLARLWPFTGELFDADAVDAEMERRGIAPGPQSVREPWLAHVAESCARATLALPQDGWVQRGGKTGRHGEHLSYLLAEMQSVRRSVPGERW